MLLQLAGFGKAHYPRSKNLPRHHLYWNHSLFQVWVSLIDFFLHIGIIPITYTPYRMFGVNGIFQDLHILAPHNQLFLMMTTLQNLPASITIVLFFKFQQLLPMESKLKLSLRSYYLFVGCFICIIDLPYLAKYIMIVADLSEDSTFEVDASIFSFSKVFYSVTTINLLDENKITTEKASESLFAISPSGI